MFLFSVCKGNEKIDSNQEYDIFLPQKLRKRLRRREGNRRGGRRVSEGHYFNNHFTNHQLLLGGKKVSV